MRLFLALVTILNMASCIRYVKLPPETSTGTLYGDNFQIFYQVSDPGWQFCTIQIVFPDKSEENSSLTNASLIFAVSGHPKTMSEKEWNNLKERYGLRIWAGRMGGINQINGIWKREYAFDGLRAFFRQILEGRRDDEVWEKVRKKLKQSAEKIEKNPELLLEEYTDRFLSGNPQRGTLHDLMDIDLIIVNKKLDEMFLKSQKLIQIYGPFNKKTDQEFLKNIKFKTAMNAYPFYQPRVVFKPSLKSFNIPHSGNSAYIKCSVNVPFRQWVIWDMYSGFISGKIKSENVEIQFGSLLRGTPVVFFYIKTQVGESGKVLRIFKQNIDKLKFHEAEVEKYRQLWKIQFMVRRNKIDFRKLLDRLIFLEGNKRTLTGILAIADSWSAKRVQMAWDSVLKNMYCISVAPKETVDLTIITGENE
ncbi:hypothetical protein KKF34_08255 [Myxococcota bacterium]|nr:hypothetical protein [Myxococcota bacterium]MBU1381602.1 hypothetical protein [Myxococcota bacterium]MBU1496854.1 hypothetical protein [Myxococcota bacterium]